MKNQDILKIKENKTSIEIASFFKKRFSPRVFSQNEIKNNDLEIIFEAVRWTPSSYNRQPWFFYLAKRGKAGFERLSALLFDGNSWAKKAPVLILGCFIENDDYGKNIYAQYDLGQAVATLVYQAQILGYYSHQMAGFDKDKAKTIVEKNHTPWVMIALGKLGDYEKAPEKLVALDFKKSQRKEKIYDVII
ncbi:MAG: nitroreductase family protein [Candidatus Microgenomates bacterium]